MELIKLIGYPHSRTRMPSLIAYCMIFAACMSEVRGEGALRSDENWKSSALEESFEELDTRQIKRLSLSAKANVVSEPQGAFFEIPFRISYESATGKPVSQMGKISFAVVQEGEGISAEPGSGSVGFTDGQIHGAVAVVVTRSSPKRLSVDVYFEVGQGSVLPASRTSNFFWPKEHFSPREALWKNVARADQILSRKIFSRTFWLKE